MSEPEYVYATTDAVKCVWCGAEPGERCHMEPGRSDVVMFDRGFPDRRYKFHTCRVDPTSEPIGVLGPERPGYAFREIIPLAVPPSSTEGDER